MRVSLSVALALLALLAWTLPLATARAASMDANSVTIEIRNPQPSGGVAEGPVGTNIYAQGQVGAGDTVAIGYADQGTGCQSGMNTISGLTPSVQANGQFTVAFTWPDAANTVNAEYNLCAQDTTTNTIGQSTTLFRVDNANAPTITIQAAGEPNAPTVGPGTPTPAPTATAQSGQAYIGGFLQINGSNFTRGGQSLLFFLTPGQFSASDYNPDSALKVASGDSRSDSNGAFQVIVQLPTGETGNFVVSAVSEDGGSGVLPSLLASQNISLTAAPATPTPLPTATTPTTPTPTGHSGTRGRPVGPYRITLLIGLGVVSVILFIIGVAFLVSASSLPKP
jgi:hypothetical protein